MKMKSQASLEYLMTYGWALLVIVLVIMGLAWMMQSAKTPDMCVAQQPFACMSPPPNIFVDTSNNLNVNVSLKNMGTMPIEVVGYVCVDQSSEEPDSAAYTSTSASISPGSQELLTVPCKKCAGGSCSPISSYKSGSTFKGRVYVKYKYEGETGERLTTMEISGTVS